MRRALAALAACLAASGCSLAPAYETPPPPVAETWPQGDAYLAQSEEALPAVTYEDVFADPRLRSLITQALENNRDLRVAYANLAAARAQVRVVRARQFPEIGASASAGYSAADGPDRADFSLGGGVTNFELDLFGRLASATEAQRNVALSSEAGARTVRLGLVADLASIWLAYAADRDLLAVANDTAAAAQASYDLTQLRLRGGIAPRSDVRQAEQVLATAQGDVAELTAALAQDENLIRRLLGTPSFDPALLPTGLAGIADSVNTLPAGTSSDVLLRRPDVIDAEYRLRAANADIGTARAELFPTISLSGLVGLAGDALDALFSGGAFAASGSAGATAPLFDFGGRRANVAVTEAFRDAAVADYERTIQSAFREVADVLATQGTIANRLAAARRNTEAAADTAELTELRYREGIDSALARLVAQRSLYQARRDEVGVQYAALANRVDLYRTLGGDSFTQAPAVFGSASE